VTLLVWYEAHTLMTAAFQREKNIKKYPHAWKIKMIETMNPKWRDLYELLF
jgi:putative endonuclease